jgi:hypothetical protein
MSPFPDELPAELDVNGECRAVADRLYSAFEAAFKSGPVLHGQVPVYYDRRDGPLGREEGFWHLVTREADAKTHRRCFEAKRAKKLSWARPLVECESHPRIRVWDYDSGNRRKGVRTYLWLEDQDYVVILKRAGRPYALVTAYDVDGPDTRRYFERLYANRV